MKSDIVKAIQDEVAGALRDALDGVISIVGDRVDQVIDSAEQEPTPGPEETPPAESEGEPETEPNEVEPKAGGKAGGPIDGMKPGELRRLGDVTGGPVEVTGSYPSRRRLEYSGLVVSETRGKGGKGAYALSRGGGHSTTFIDSVGRLDLQDTGLWLDDYAPTFWSEMTKDNFNPQNISWIVEDVDSGEPLERPVSSHSYDLLQEVDGVLVDMSGRGLLGGAAPVELRDWKGKRKETIAHYTNGLAGPAWDFTTALSGEMPARWDAGNPGSAVYNGKIYLFGTKGLFCYDPKTRVKTHLSAGSFSGYETTMVHAGDGVFYAIGRLNKLREVQLTRIQVNPTVKIDILGFVSVKYSESSTSSQVFGWCWDSKNQVIGRVFDGRYDWIDPAGILSGYFESGSVVMKSLDAADNGLTAFFHNADVTDGVMVFCTKEGKTFAYCLPEITRDKSGRKAPTPIGKIPFGDLDALQAAKLAPVETDAGGEQPGRNFLIWDHGTGGRPDIGNRTGWQRRWLATRNTALLDQIIAQAKAGEPWDDYDAMMLPKKRGGTVDLSFAHTPAAFYIPYLMTGDAEMLRRKELLWSYYCRKRGRAVTDGVVSLTGREFAWQLRNLYQLAILEMYGHTERRIYIEALRRTRERLDSVIADTNYKYKAIRVFEINDVTKADRSFTGWMESFKGIVINDMIATGHFDDWRSIAAWHLDHLAMRSGDAWPANCFDVSHVYFDGVENIEWSNLQPYRDKPGNEKLSYYLQQPKDEPLPTGWLTFISYGHQSYLWAKGAAENGIKGGSVLQARIYDLLARRGNDSRYKKV